MDNTHVHALDYLSVIRRRKAWGLVPVVASIVVGWALVRFLPKEYRSSTTLGVTAPAIAPNLVGQAPPFDNQERLRAISQQLLSVDMLGRVVREEGLASEEPADAAIARLRKAITITVPDPVATTGEPRRLDTFVVSYSNGDPARAQQIANRLATVFVDENSKSRFARAEGTSAFIATELAASQAHLDEVEARLRTAKEAHMGQLPEQTQGNLQTLGGLRQQLAASTMTLRGEQDRLALIERQITALRQGNADVFVPRSDAAAPPEIRMITLQRDLAAARAMYTDKHPEVVRLVEELAEARKDAAAVGQRPESDRLSTLQLDPVYRQLAADRETTRLRTQELERSAADLQRQINGYQQRVDAAPMVEQQLASLQREFDLERQQYADLTGKQRAAAIAENVARNRTGEQFMVLYAATFPTTPAQPIPMRVMLVSLLGGLCLGGALMLGREYFDRSVHDVRDLRDEFELPVLGQITRIAA